VISVINRADASDRGVVETQTQEMAMAKNCGCIHFAQIECPERRSSLVGTINKPKE
jgi:hypothetical protein